MNTRVAAFPDEIEVVNQRTFVTSRSRFSVEGVMQSIRNFATLSEALRLLGATVLLASMSVFLLQGWSEGNDISRYLLLLAQTGLLAVAGFAMSHWVRETRGARLFFGLALVSIPANFTILGALLYSVFQWDAGLSTYPGYASWQIEDVANIGITLGGAMLVLIPVTMFCFAIMARHSAKTLSLHFLLVNALLLLPIRGSLAAGTVGLLGVLYALTIVSKLTRKNPALKTGEGKFALATLFIPLGIIMFRSMYFYHVDSLMVAMVSLALFLAARQASLFPDRSARLATLLEVLSLPLALTAALAFTGALEFGMNSGLHAPVFAGAYTCMALDIMRRTGSRILSNVTGVSISLFVALSFSFSVANSPSALTALLSLVAGVTLLLWGLAGRKPFAAIAGIVTAFAAFRFGAVDIMQLIVNSSWIDLAIFGAAAITLGSVIDRHGVAIKLRVTRWFNTVREEKEPIALEE